MFPFYQYMSDIANFTTPLAAGNRSSFKFIVYGDMGVRPFPEGVTTAKLVRQEIEENDVRFVYHHGDISYARGYVSLEFVLVFVHNLDFSIPNMQIQRISSLQYSFRCI